MDRNTTRSPRVDEQLEHEVQSFVQGTPAPHRDDDRLQEEIGRLEPGRQPRTAEPLGDHPSIDETFDRAEFARWFRPSDFPCSVEQMRETAVDEGAPSWVIAALDRLDGSRRFPTIGEV